MAESQVCLRTGTMTRNRRRTACRNTAPCEAPPVAANQLHLCMRPRRPRSGERGGHVSQRSIGRRGRRKGLVRRRTTGTHPRARRLRGPTPAARRQGARQEDAVAPTTICDRFGEVRLRFPTRFRAILRWKAVSERRLKENADEPGSGTGYIDSENPC
jgi:hypothetical protein